MPIIEEKRKYLKKYRQDNKVHISKVAKVKYQRNKKKYRAKAYKDYHANPQHFLKMAKKSRDNNKEQISSKWNESAKKNKEVKSIQAKTRRLFGHLKHNGKCETCKTKDNLTFHHIKPYRYDVFQILCRKCHYKLHGYNNFIDEENYSFDEINDKESDNE